MANIQVLAKANVLGTPIDAGFMKNGAESVMVVYGKPEIPSVGETISQFITKIGKMVDGFPTANDIKGKLPKKLADAFDNITVTLQEVYLVIKSEDKTEENTTTTTTTTKPTSEFAFWLEISSGNLTEGWPIEVQSVSFKIWSTTNPKILEEMNISEMQKLLNYSTNIES